MAVGDGDYIIEGVEGEYYPCKHDIFLNTYTEAEGKNTLELIGEESYKLGEELHEYANKMSKRNSVGARNLHRIANTMQEVLYDLNCYEL